MEQITQAFILAAVRGKRMQHLTDDKPKPLVQVAGKCLIDYNINHVKQAGIKDCIVNLCYKGEMIKEHLLKRGDLNFIFSEEEEALETGGGIKHALPKMERSPFLVINSDALWADENDSSLLEDMMQAWNGNQYDMMLMLQPLEQAYGAAANGDYQIIDGRPVRRRNTKTHAPYLYGGVMVCHPRVFDNEPEGRYWLIDIFDRLQATGRLGYYIHKGKWFHVGDPAATQIAEDYFSK